MKRVAVLLMAAVLSMACVTPVYAKRKSNPQAQAAQKRAKQQQKQAKKLAKARQKQNKRLQSSR